MRTLIALLLVVAAFTGVVYLHTSLVSLHDTYPTEFRSYYIPSSKTLKVVSLGQRNFAADLVFTWAVQFFDRYGMEVRDTYLLHTFEVITDLDPQFQEAYIFGNLFLSIDQRWDLVFQLAEKGIENNPENWILPWDAGTYAFFQAKDYPRAKRYFAIAGARNRSNLTVQRLLANSLKYEGDYEKALEYWQTLLAENRDNETSAGRLLRFSAERNIYDLTIKIHLRSLRAALDRYKRDRGIWPQSLGSLVREGYLTGLPVDPEGKAYLYDQATGGVECQSPFKYRGKAAQW